MKKITFTIIIIISVVIAINSCDNFLTNPPKGVVSQEQLTHSVDNIDGLVIAAYASLQNDFWQYPYSSPWPYGSVRSDDSYKGGLGTADIGEFNRMEQFNILRTDDATNNSLWEAIYVGIGRANTAISAIKVFSGDHPNKEQRIAEMRFVRGHYYFLLKIIFKYFPYIDETVPADKLSEVSNDAYTDDELWEKIAEDFQSGVENLPLQNDDVGRADQLSAKAYLAKVRLYQAYKQADPTNYQVSSINQEKLEEVITLTGDIINSGEFDLFDDFAKNFLWDFENGKESIFAVQRSKDDGTADGNLDRGNSLNYPVVAEYGCCSFNRPSQNMVNAFQTNVDGLPKFDDYNNVEINTNQEFHDVTSFDPRLGHTVSIPGEPYKYQNGLIYDPISWTRAVGVYGVFSDVKPIQKVTCPCFARLGYGFPSSSKNNNVIRYDDVLLWRAEALIELNRQQEALPLINQIRERAENSTNLLVDASSNYIANFYIDTYKDGININWTQENARKALRWERRLEFSMEGVRFFDLVRWGIADQVMNDYFEIEKDRHSYLQNAGFLRDQSEYLPIPQQQINFSKGLYKQNLGY